MKVVVAGAGDTGIAISKQFLQGDNGVVMIDERADALESARELLGIETIVGNILHRGTLRAARVAKADAFIAVTSRDAENVVAAGIAKEEGARVTLARVDDAHFYPSAKGSERDVLGVDAVLCATRLAVSELLGILPRRELTRVHTFSTTGLRVAFAPVRAGSALLHKSPQNLKLPEGATIAGVAREGFLRTGADIQRLELDDRLLVVGHGDEFLDVWTALFPEAKEQRALIVGGGDVGELIATALAPRIARVDLIELNRGRAADLQKRLPNVNVTAGDARQASCLRDLDIAAADHFLTVTRSDEINLLVSLLGRRLGANHVLTLLRQAGHAELFGEVGVEGAAGAFEILARTVFDLACPEGLVGERSLEGTGYTLIEWRCPQRAGDAVVADVPVPPSGSIIGIGRDGGHVDIARQTGLRPSDTLLIVISKRERDDLEKRLRRFNKEGWR